MGVTYHGCTPQPLNSYWLSCHLLPTPTHSWVRLNARHNFHLNRIVVIFPANNGYSQTTQTAEQFFKPFYGEAVCFLAFFVSISAFCLLVAAGLECPQPCRQASIESGLLATLVCAWIWKWQLSQGLPRWLSSSGGHAANCVLKAFRLQATTRLMMSS